MKRIAILILLGLLVWPASSHAMNVGDPTPDFQAVTITGKEISYYRDIKGKKPLYLIFGATW
jgi:peroxiredoxin